MSTTQSPNQSLVERLFSAGAHFGFSKSRRHPTIKPFLFANKQGTDIFDLEKIAGHIDDVKALLAAAGKDGKTVLFVSTKDEASALVKAAAESVEMPYVTNRWIGGMLTNFSEIKKRIDRLHALTTEGETGELERKYTKKERVVIGRELAKLHTNFAGIKKLEKMPHLMVVVDPRHDAIAVTEATEMGIPVIGVMSSDNDVRRVTYPVVVNDALQSSIALILSELTTALKAGQAEYVPKPTAERTTRTRRPEMRRA